MLSLPPRRAAAQSFGIFWIVLFDMMLSHDPAHTRAVHFSQVLSHLRRALALQDAEQQREPPLPGTSPAARRPLIVIDHFDELLRRREGGGGGGATGGSGTFAGSGSSFVVDGSSADAMYFVQMTERLVRAIVGFRLFGETVAPSTGQPVRKRACQREVFLQALCLQAC